MKVSDKFSKKTHSKSNNLEDQQLKIGEKKLPDFKVPYPASKLTKLQLKILGVLLLLLGVVILISQLFNL